MVNIRSLESRQESAHPQIEWNAYHDRMMIYSFVQFIPLKYSELFEIHKIIVDKAPKQ